MKRVDLLAFNDLKTVLLDQLSVVGRVDLDCSG